ncbi:MAG: type IV pilus twitching motility protein PilT [Verrucomicrobiales bacterium]
MVSPTILRHLHSTRQHGASDLFLDEGGPPRVKLHGAVQELQEPAVTRADLAGFWLACGADPEKDNDYDASYALEEGARFRVSLFRHSGRLGAAMRVIKVQVPTMDSLELPEHVLIPWLQRRSGLILVTGATGSGKSTTLASCLEWLNSHYQKHIITLEDPVEYQFTSRHSLFTQREIGTDTNSFPRALRAALRQAPDVILLGEIRDAETAFTALQACETGHLVLSTLHSTDCVDTLERLNTMFPDRERHSGLLLLSMQLVGILSQILLPRAGEKGGMTVLCEYIENSGATRPWIRMEKLPEIRDHLNRSQTTETQSFLRALLAALREGRITEETALAAAPNPGDLQRALRGLI